MYSTPAAVAQLEGGGTPGPTLRPHVQLQLLTPEGADAGLPTPSIAAHYRILRRMSELLRVWLSLHKGSMGKPLPQDLQLYLITKKV